MLSLSKSLSVKLEAKPAKMPVSLNGTPAFGTVCTPGMLLCSYRTGWQEAVITERTSLPLDPATMTLHYAQSIFEGLKAHRLTSGKLGIFRPHDHGERFRRSAERMVMAPMDPEMFVQLVFEFTRHQQRALPEDPALTLYLRPLLFGTDTALGLRASKNFQFLILGIVVADYFSHGRGLKVLVHEETVRTCARGMGAAKTAGNYAASLYGQVQAVKAGCDQALWLDGQENTYVEELGAMNIFFVREGTLITPALTGSILAGITRDSVLTLAREKGIPVQEAKLPWPELAFEISKGLVTEAFATGTAAVISPIAEFVWKGKSLPLPSEHPVADQLKSLLVDIQKGKIPHPWMTEL